MFVSGLAAEKDVLRDLSSAGIFAESIDEVDPSQIADFCVTSWRQMQVSYKAICSASHIIDKLCRLSRFLDNAALLNASVQIQACKFHFREIQKTIKTFESVVTDEMSENERIKSIISVISGVDEMDVDASNFDIHTIRSRIFEFASVMQISQETFTLIQKAFDEVDRIDSNTLRENSEKLAVFYSIVKTNAKKKNELYLQQKSMYLSNSITLN